MANKNFKITLRRRLANGELQSATYRLEHLFSTGDDTEQSLLLLDAEVQANSGYIVDQVEDDKRAPVRVWVEETE